ncbi:L,D-transpeptidase family protein [uncultured Acetobacteroides sp.]|uniref:L,D-transpeptidase family protein n=1 Tax=uncultured Acetobacteroides sp. TaxID=1760811 RepID=UPI0029F4E98E|nr:L,D-transpeptidase family protein [uncultured Acetobacteroides sp.]
MTKTTIISLLGIVLLSFTIKTDFLGEQKKYERVRIAIKEKQGLLEKTLKENQISIGNLNLLLVAYKDNDLLEIYAKNKQDGAYKKILSYEVCSRSGQLGPKRKSGDGQVPEGFYHIDRFNPTSNFYLSLGLSYPNLADKRKSKASNLGGGIFVHGSCVTIGCLPMTDDYIKEIYLLAVYARNNGQNKIPVYIFPFKMTDQNMKTYKAKHKGNKELISFWDNLKIGYGKFIKDSKELNIKVAENGDYIY